MSYWHLAMESLPVCFMVTTGYPQNPSKHVTKQGREQAMWKAFLALFLC